MKQFNPAALVGALIAAILALLAATARRHDSGSRFVLCTIQGDELNQYLDDHAAFTSSVSCAYPNPPEEVFEALLDEQFMSWVPFVRGVTYADETRAVGTQRTLRHWFAAVSERIVVMEPNRLLGVSVSGISIPLILRSAGTLYQVFADGNGGTRLIWRVGGTPQWIGHLPLWLAAPLIRPAATAQMAKLRVILPPP